VPYKYPSTLQVYNYTDFHDCPFVSGSNSYDRCSPTSSLVLLPRLHSSSNFGISKVEFAGAYCLLSLLSRECIMPFAIGSACVALTLATVAKPTIATLPLALIATFNVAQRAISFAPNSSISARARLSLSSTGFHQGADFHDSIQRSLRTE
jgi:hypothetical protein